MRSSLSHRWSHPPLQLTPRRAGLTPGAASQPVAVACGDDRMGVTRCRPGHGQVRRPVGTCREELWKAYACW